MENPSSSSEEYLREALENCNIAPDEASRLVLFCERGEPQDASEYLHLAIAGDGEHVIEEYLRRRSNGRQSESVSDSSGKHMQIYKKPELSLRTPVTGKYKKKVTPDTQARKNASLQSKHNQLRVGGSTANPEKEHIEQTVTAGIYHINLRQRELCDCQARKHKLVTNCLHCGKIVCEKEGEGPCTFCGNEVLCGDSSQQHSRGPTEGKLEAEHRANMLKNKLLAQDRRGNLQKSIIDDQGDWYSSDGNAWMTPEEKKLQQSLCEDAESVNQNRSVLLLNTAVGKVSFTSEDDILKSDPALHFEIKENVQTVRIIANPNIRDCPVYVPTEKSAKHDDLTNRRIPESVKVRSGRVQDDGPSVKAVFDICMPKSDAECEGGKTIELSLSLYAQRKLNREITEDRNKIQQLKPGMIMLKNWLSKNDQVGIVKTCQTLGIGEGGFYQPGYGDRSKMHLWMMCLGMNWNPESKSYEKIRSNDNERPPAIPKHFITLVEKGIEETHNALKRDSKLKAEDLRKVLPHLHPDVCLVNFYKESGKLGLHQDKDESKRSIDEGLPVVSFSIGDAAEFLYGNDRNPDIADRIMLESGDVLIFGGESRLVFHGISHVKPRTCPKWLIKETGLRPGRVNLTFRKI